MVPDPALLLILTLFGAWAAADGTSIGQILISRPIFAATIAGAIAGDPLAGVLVGAALEIFHLAVLPAGAARNPESGPAAVAGGAAFALTATGWYDLLIVIAICLVLETIAGVTVHRMRQLRMPMATFEHASDLDPDEVLRKHLGAVGLDLLRGAALTAIAFMILLPVLQMLPTPSSQVEQGARLIVAGAAAALLTAAGRMFAPRPILVAIGAGIGALFLIAL